MAGNANSGRREKPFVEALRMELKSKPNARKLRLIARQLINRAAEGDMPAIKEFADRLDGRPAQAIEGDFTHDLSDPLMELMSRIADGGSRLGHKVSDDSDT